VLVVVSDDGTNNAAACTEVAAAATTTTNTATGAGPGAAAPLSCTSKCHVMASVLAQTGFQWERGGAPVHKDGGQGGASDSSADPSSRTAESGATTAAVVFLRPGDLVFQDTLQVRTCVLACVHVCVYVCVRVCARACVHVRACVRARVRVCPGTCPAKACVFVPSGVWVGGNRDLVGSFLPSLTLEGYPSRVRPSFGASSTCQVYARTLYRSRAAVAVSGFAEYSTPWEAGVVLPALRPTARDREVAASGNSSTNAADAADDGDLDLDAGHDASKHDDDDDDNNNDDDDDDTGRFGGDADVLQRAVARLQRAAETRRAAADLPYSFAGGLMDALLVGAADRELADPGVIRVVCAVLVA
jgi:hypothetical protein